MDKYYSPCPICKCLLARLPLDTAAKLCDVSIQYSCSIDSLIRAIQGPTSHINLNALINESRLEIAFGRFILDLANKLRLTVLVKWLNDKLIKLNQWWNKKIKIR